MYSVNEEQAELLNTVNRAMQSYLGADQCRIDHALQVADYAREMLDYIDADPVVTMCAAYLHDIGIHEAERKHNSSAGNWQELEGPPIARQILTDLGVEADCIERVAEIVGKHHTPAGVDAPEFRIIWDADALVNFVEVRAGKSEAEMEAIINRHMVTEPGFQKARQVFLGHERTWSCPV